jgi:hypothetical protein
MSRGVEESRRRRSVGKTARRQDGKSETGGFAGSEEVEGVEDVESQGSGAEPAGGGHEIPPDGGITAGRIGVGVADRRRRKVDLPGFVM